MLLQVQALKDKNILPEEWTVPLPEDTAVPKRKGDMLARYYEIRVRGEPRIPDLLTSLPPTRSVPQSFLPPLLPAVNSPCDENSFTDENQDLSNELFLLPLHPAVDSQSDENNFTKLTICCCGVQCRIQEDEDDEPDFYCRSCNLYAHSVCGSPDSLGWICIACSIGCVPKKS